MVHTLRRGARAALAAVAGAALLVGCTEEPQKRVMPGPTSTATAAPQDAVALAERYRAAGGDPDVYGIQVEDGPEGVPRVVIRTRNADQADAIFRRREHLGHHSPDDEGGGVIQEGLLYRRLRPRRRTHPPHGRSPRERV